MAIKLGMDGKIYYCAASVATPTWSELTNVKDVTLNLETGEADVTTRGNNGWRATKGTLKDGSVTFTMVWDTADAGFTAIQAAWSAGNPIGIACMDGDIETEGSQGLVADMAVTNFSRNEPLEEAMTVDVTLKPTYSDTAAAWTVVSES